jgi:simple sugar transport system ATP-binding protein
VNPVLELTGITKRFQDVTALDEAALTVRAGTIHALLGENGAGKTTLMRIAFGMLRPDRGTLRADGRPVQLRSPRDALNVGIGMVHQHFTLVPAMTVTENIVLGEKGRFDRTAARARVQALVEKTGLHVEPDALVRDLPVGGQQRVEILKALARDIRLLILDEPTAVLAPAEAEELLAWIRAFPAGDRAVVLITHKLREARSVVHDVTVLRAGRTVFASPINAVDDAMLITAMIGNVAGIGPSTGHDTVTPGSVVLRLSGVGSTDERGRILLHDVSLEVKAGELLGIAAVEGSGHHELLRVLSGRRRPVTGTVEIPAAVAFIAEDRHRDAAILDFTLTENIGLRDLDRRRGRMSWTSVEEQAARILDEHDIRASGPSSRLRELSGGNQQKLIVGRELEPLPVALVAENPTRGLDVKATAAVHQRLRAARDAGTAVVLHSSDVDEVLALCDRVVVVHAGRVTAVARERDAVAHSMLGAVA